LLSKNKLFKFCFFTSLIIACFQSSLYLASQQLIMADDQPGVLAPVPKGVILAVEGDHAYADAFKNHEGVIDYKRCFGSAQFDHCANQFYGIDLINTNNIEEKRILAPVSGTIHYLDHEKACVLIQMVGGYNMNVCHFERFASNIIPNAKIKQGELLGYITGVHIHLSIDDRFLSNTANTPSLAHPIPFTGRFALNFGLDNLIELPPIVPNSNDKSWINQYVGKVFPPSTNNDCSTGCDGTTTVNNPGSPGSESSDSQETNIYHLVIPHNKTLYCLDIYTHGNPLTDSKLQKYIIAHASVPAGNMTPGNCSADLYTVEVVIQVEIYGASGLPPLPSGVNYAALKALSCNNIANNLRKSDTSWGDNKSDASACYDTKTANIYRYCTDGQLAAGNDNNYSCPISLPISPNIPVPVYVSEYSVSDSSCATIDIATNYDRFSNSVDDTTLKAVESSCRSGIPAPHACVSSHDSTASFHFYAESSSVPASCCTNNPSASNCNNPSPIIPDPSLTIAPNFITDIIPCDSYLSPLVQLGGVSKKDSLTTQNSNYNGISSKTDGTPVICYKDIDSEVARYEIYATCPNENTAPHQNSSHNWSCLKDSALPPPTQDFQAYCTDGTTSNSCNTAATITLLSNNYTDINNMSSSGSGFVNYNNNRCFTQINDCTNYVAANNNQSQPTINSIISSGDYLECSSNYAKSSPLSTYNDNQASTFISDFSSKTNLGNNTRLCYNANGSNFTIAVECTSEFKLPAIISLSTPYNCSIPQSLPPINTSTCSIDSVDSSCQGIGVNTSSLSCTTTCQSTTALGSDNKYKCTCLAALPDLTRCSGGSMPGCNGQTINYTGYAQCSSQCLNQNNTLGADGQYICSCGTTVPPTPTYSPSDCSPNTSDTYCKSHIDPIDGLIVINSGDSCQNNQGIGSCIASGADDHSTSTSTKSCSCVIPPSNNPPPNKCSGAIDGSSCNLGSKFGDQATICTTVNNIVGQCTASNNQGDSNGYTCGCIPTTKIDNTTCQQDNFYCSGSKVGDTCNFASVSQDICVLNQNSLRDTNGRLGCTCGSNIGDAGKKLETNKLVANIFAATKKADSESLKKVVSKPTPPVSKILGATSNSTAGINITTSGHYVFSSGGKIVAQKDIVINGNSVQVKLYVDKYGDGTHHADEPYLTSYTYIQFANVETVQNYQLNSGWNLINIPLIDKTGSISTVADLIKYWLKQGANIKSIARFNNGQFDIFVDSLTGNNYSAPFKLIPGEALFILNNGASINVTFPGNAIVSPVPITLQSGWNLVGIISPKKYTANSLLTAINAKGFNADTCSDFTSGLYNSLIIKDGQTYGNDFNIVPTKGYFIRVDSSTNSTTTFSP